ncbi:hypothetical protein ABZ820_40555 [Streptomyces diacarni]|uniref:hypothetical protein n=1 Tax=Streptomyces diacarni TaxID=2800381 RepID=UPI0034019CF2
MGAQLQNWESSIQNVLTGFQSRRWSDQGSYSQVWFTNCRSSPATGPDSTDVDLRRDNPGLPDNSWGSKHYTACFGGTTAKSSGQWTNIKTGNQFFQIKKINDHTSGHRLGVARVYVDTSKAD